VAELPAFVSKSEYAYQELRRRILDGDFLPGERLLLRSVADLLGLSVMPVRDALKMLERDGLVLTEIHRGATVAPLSSAQIIDAISIRMWLEVLAVREAVPLHTAETCRETRALYDAADAVLATGDGLAYASANRRLHEAIERPAREALRTMIAETWERLWQARRRMSLFSLLPDSRTSAQREHREIVAAVEAGSVEGAAAAMERHRESTLAAWEAALASLAQPRE
jgi:DNA-binding GntR family transcriptional regulator